MTHLVPALGTLRDRLATAGRSLLPPPDRGQRGEPSRGWFERVFVPAIVMVWAVGEPVIGVGRVLDGPHRPAAAVAAVVAGTCSVPLYLWLLVPAARARRPRHLGWLIAVFTAVNLAAFVVIGAWWFGAGVWLAVLAAVYLPLRWSVPTVAALAAAPAAMAMAGRDMAQSVYYAHDIPLSALMMGLLIWIARAAARLQTRRRELADSAVIAERVRIDDELGVSIGAELRQLIAAGEHAGQTAADDPAAAERELQRLTRASRAALTQTRRMVSHYRASTVRSELTTAVAVLAAAGIDARADVPAAVLDQELDSRQLAGFRTSLTSLLRDDTVCGCLITAGGSNADLRLDIHGRHRVTS